MPVKNSAAARRSPKARGAAPKSQTERREATTAQILDAAEKLFALHGRDGVTLRAVAQEASVDAPLVHYYFGDMDGLFRAVFNRKSAVINAIRNQAMDEYLAIHGDDLTVEGALDVFLRPVFQTMAENPAYWANFGIIISYTITLRRDRSAPTRYSGQELMREAYDEVVNRFIGMLRKLAPQAPEPDIYWFFHHVIGSLALALAQTGRIDALSGGQCQSSDMKAVLESMIRVFSAGFEAIKARSVPALKKKKA